MTDTIAQLIRGKIAELENEIAAAERALRALSGLPIPTPVSHTETVANPKMFAPHEFIIGEDPLQKQSLSDIIIDVLSRGPANRKAIVSAVQAIRPATNPQTVSGTLNAAQKVGKIKLNKKTKQWQLVK